MKVSVSRYLAYLFKTFFFDALKRSFHKKPSHFCSPFAEMLKLLAHHDGPRFVVLMTDGMWCSPDIAISQADKCKAAGIQTIAIGFGSAKKDFLERVATTQSGAYFTTLTELTTTFGTIAREIAETGGGQFSGSGKTLRFLSRH